MRPVSKQSAEALHAAADLIERGDAPDVWVALEQATGDAGLSAWTPGANALLAFNDHVTDGRRQITVPEWERRNSADVVVRELRACADRGANA